MLRAVVVYARLVNHVGQVLGMSRRKAIVPPRLDVQQFVEWVAVGQPGRSFLVGAKQITQSIECQGHGKPHAGTNLFAPFEIGAYLHDRPAPHVRFVMGFSLFIDEMPVRVIVRAEPKINTSILRNGHAQRVDALLDGRPAFGHRDEFVGPIVAVFVDHQHNPASAGYKHALAALIARRR